MAREVLSVPVDYTIRQATEYLQTLAPEKKGKVSYIYVVDQNRRLAGVIQIRDLVFYPQDKPVKEIVKPGVVQVETAMSQTDVARLLERHRYLGLPVVDEEQRLVGVVSADAVLRVFEEEASDDIAKLVGTSTEEIRTHSVRRIVRVRMPWLFVNIASGFLCALITGFFENNLEVVATLFLFVPMVLGLSESAGVQSATIVVRNLTLGETRLSSLGALFVREALAAVLIGGICGGIVGTIAYLWKSMPHAGVALACSMSLAIIISALIGLTLPLLFKRFKIDPAIASGPLVLAICDLQTLLVYFSLSSRILSL
jgi:magnesium transporter